MRKYFLLLAAPFAAFLLSGCNLVSYLMLFEYSSAEKPDDVADTRMTELEREREGRMLSNPNYRDSEIDAYRRMRGSAASPDTMDTRPVSTEELRARLEKQAASRGK